MTKVRRTELGEVMYQFEEIFNSPKEASERKIKGEDPKFTVLEQKIQQVNIKPIEKESSIEHRGKKDVRPTKDSAIEKSTTTGSGKDE